MTSSEKRSLPDRPFDLIILDLDGTILDLYKAVEISATVCRTIDAVQDAGIPVTIGTGRTLDYVRAQVRDMGITTPAITTQGAVIGDPVTGDVLIETDMPLVQASEIAAWIDETRPVSALYFVDDDGRFRIYQNIPSPDPDFTDHVFGRPRTLHARFRDLVPAPNGRPPIKFITVNDPAVERDIAPYLKARFEPDLTITRTHPVLVEGTARGVDKGEGVRRLCTILGINPQRVLAIGDSDNDIPMLAAAGTAVAMGNATSGVKAIADWVAPPIDEDGAAVALKRFVLDPIRTA